MARWGNEFMQEMQEYVAKIDRDGKQFIKYLVQFIIFQLQLTTYTMIGSCNSSVSRTSENQLSSDAMLNSVVISRATEHSLVS